MFLVSQDQFLSLTILPSILPSGLLAFFLAVSDLCSCVGFSLVVVSGDYSLVAEHRFEGVQLPGFRAQAQYLWRMHLVAPRHVKSSKTRDRTCVYPFFTTDPPGKPIKINFLRERIR